VRIYPSKNSDFYDCFLSSGKQLNQSLFQFLYSEVFVSFKDVKTPSKAFEIKQVKRDKREEHHKNLSDNLNITRELYAEYLLRILKLLK